MSRIIHTAYALTSSQADVMGADHSDVLIQESILEEGTTVYTGYDTYIFGTVETTEDMDALLEDGGWERTEPWVEAAGQTIARVQHIR